MLGSGTQRQSHGQTHPLLDDCPFQEYTLPVVGYFARDDPVGDVLHLREVSGFIIVRKLGDFREYSLADVIDRCMDSTHSHSGFLLLFVLNHVFYPA